MIQTKVSYEEYLLAVKEVTNEYTSKQTDYSWKCNQYSETLDGTYYFYMTNRFQTTKLMYIAAAKILDTTNIYHKDLEIINKLRETL